MAATARVVVLMSPAEKAALDAKVARRPGISAGEFVRRAVDAYEADDAGDAADLKNLLGVLAGLRQDVAVSLAQKIDRLSDNMLHMSDRLTRLETIIDIARPNAPVRRIT